jgi:hypothetical protein
MIAVVGRLQRLPGFLTQKTERPTRTAAMALGASMIDRYRFDPSQTDGKE